MGPTMFARSLRRLIALAMFIPVGAGAQTWQPLTDESALRDLFVDTVITTQVNEDVTAVSRYRRD